MELVLAGVDEAVVVVVVLAGKTVVVVATLKVGRPALVGVDIGAGSVVRAEMLALAERAAERLFMAKKRYSVMYLSRSVTGRGLTVVRGRVQIRLKRCWDVLLLLVVLRGRTVYRDR